MIGVDAKNIALANAPQGRFDIADAIDAVGCNPTERRVAGDGARDHGARHGRLGGKAGAFRHMGFGHARRIVRPGLGQIERPIDEGMTVARHIASEYPDLAIGDLARRAGILPRHAARRLALLEEAGFIDHQDGIGIDQRLQRVIANDVAQRIRIPAPAAKNGLLPPRTRITPPLRPASSRSCAARRPAARP